ncbi:hypothetical protein Tco_0382824 [Tanacetum coccineum]
MLSDLSRKTKEAYRNLCEIQEVTMSNPSSQSMEEEALAYTLWSRLADIKERYIKQKAKLRWVKLGDQKNKSFSYRVNEEEIRKVVFAMPREKSQGPDGFTIEFFKDTWCNTLKSEHAAECLNIRGRYIYGSIAQDLRTTTKRVV